MRWRSVDPVHGSFHTRGKVSAIDSARAVLFVESHCVGLMAMLVFLLKGINPAQRFVPIRLQCIGNKPMIRIAV